MQCINVLFELIEVINTPKGCQEVTIAKVDGRAIVNEQKLRDFSYPKVKARVSLKY
jgi:hypothetical protein